jgi:hypothetical protein
MWTARAPYSEWSTPDGFRRDARHAGIAVASRRALPVLALHVGATLAAMFPVWWFQW